MAYSPVMLGRHHSGRPACLNLNCHSVHGLGSSHTWRSRPQDAWSEKCNGQLSYSRSGAAVLPAPPHTVAAGPEWAAKKVTHGVPLPAVPAPLSADDGVSEQRLTALV